MKFSFTRGLVAVSMTLSSVLFCSVAGSAASDGQGPGCPMDHTWRMPRQGGVYYPPLNDGLQYYAFSNMGNRVGTGECADLVHSYLTAVGAKSFHQLGPTGLDADYVWGNYLTTATPGGVDLSSVMPGDVVQLRDVAVSSMLGSTIWTKSAKHHTAIVFSISPDNKQFCVFEQNPQPVSYGWYDLRGMQQGTMWFYRPTY